MTSAEYMRELRKRAADRGMCTQCRNREPSGENRNCDVCLDTAKRTKQRSDCDFCVDCQAFGFHRVACVSAPKAVAQ